MSQLQQQTQPSTPHSSAHAPLRAGLSFGLTAYLFWGLIPIFWKQLADVPAAEILAYRVVGTLASVAVLLMLLGQLQQVTDLLRRPRQCGMLALSAALIGGNWFIFIFAVNSGRIIDTSLGYYLSPLLSVACGVAFFREGLTRSQTLAVLLAALGVAYMTLDLGRLPWISILLSSTFALYGVLRKLCAVGSLVGLMFEASLLCVPAALFLASGPTTVSLHSLSPGTLGLLLGCGPVTAFPLACFAAAATRIPLSTLGLIQYIAPSLSLVVAVALYGETFTRTHGVTFSLIFAALALYSWDLYRTAPRNA